MTCNTCGSSIEDFNRFCPKCGAAVQFQTSPTVGQASSPSSYTPPQQQMYSGPVAPPKKSGCGKIILILGIILVLLLGAVAAAIYFGYGALEKKLKSSEAYTVALQTLKDNPEVKDKMGEIQETGFPIGAYTTNNDGSGDAAFVMSVTGSKTTGQYKVEMRRSNSVWKIVKGDVSLANGEVINILDRSDLETDTDIDANDNSAPSPTLPGDSRSVRTISGGVLNGKATSLPKPAYPPSAKQVNASGTVMVQVLVDEKGNVVTAQAVSGHPLLRPAAVAAARQAKFSPTKLSGKPVKVSGMINYQFAPEGN
jgi:TonB family protein